MELLQRWIIVQSILYYEMDYNIVSDQVYDKNCYQLVEMIKEHPDVYKETQYYYCMFDFDGSTGFDIRGRLNEHDNNYLTHIASNLKNRGFSNEKDKGLRANNNKKQKDNGRAKTSNKGR